MKSLFHFPTLFILLGVIAPLWTCHAQTNFFTDTFNRGSTIDSLTPVAPTTNSTSYEAISSKVWYPPPSLASHDLEFGISNTSGGMDEIQAMFATNPVSLYGAGTDYIQLTIVFTNTSGGLLSSGQCYLGIGLYNTQGATNYPVPGGLNNVEANSGATATNVTGNCQLWEGYAAEVAWEGMNQGDLIMTRPQQTTSPTGNNAQDLVTKGSGSQSYSYPAGKEIGSTAPSDLSLVLTNGGTYTEVFNISLDTNDNLDLTNYLYSGPTTNGTQLAQYGTIAAGVTNIAASFNGFAFGFYQKTAGPSNVLDVSSIVISGMSSAPSGPPTITSEPSSVLVTTNGSCAFTVSAEGNVTYQWQRNGTNLVNGGNISGATSDMLVISPATTTDQLSQANGYDVVVTIVGLFSAYSTTNSLTLIASTNLIWTDNDSDVWDVNNSINWEDTNGNSSVFNFGDPVVFNDVGFGGPVELDNSYLSAASLTMAAVNFPYTFSGASTGGFAGSGSLLYTGPAKFTIDNVNTYTGGTLISNTAAYLLLQNLGGLGSGPLTLGEAGGEMEMVPAGNANSGIQGNVIVADNFMVLVDATNESYSGVFLGDLSGVSGKTLTLTNGTANPGGFYRIRAYGNATTYNANLNLANSAIIFAAYSSSGSQSYNGVISGSGQFMEKGTTTYLNGPNTYSGGTTPAQGAIGLGLSSVNNPVPSGPIGTGPLLVAPDSTTSVTGNGMIFASASNTSIANAIQYPSGTNNLTLQVGGTNNLTLTGPFTLQGNDDLTTNTITSRTVQVTNTALTTISGVMSDGGLNYGFSLSGNGVLALNNHETYTGPTTNSGGTLLVNGQIGSGNVIIATNATLGGIGVITSPVTIQGGGTLTAGNQATAGNQGIGTLAISNTLTFQAGSTNLVEVSKTAGTQDLVTGLTSVTYNGTLVAVNLAGTLAAGNSFTNFSAAAHLGNFNAIVGSPGPGLGWNFNPTNGVLSVVTGVAVNPTNITFSVSGGNLNLSWPADHLGWFLQVQTNSVVHGIGTNWVTVPNSGAVDSTNFPIVPANGTVFYRLMYP
jgi:hypothetical protein